MRGLIGPPKSHFLTALDRTRQADVGALNPVLFVQMPGASAQETRRSRVLIIGKGIHIIAMRTREGLVDD